mmetsp:Transcript_38984/g.112567  ORF Transcript_38984/g.112567 Transcript_38984/m.112567 type:complete len:225 (-) Transcript_38984:327-1001(-)
MVGRCQALQLLRRQPRCERDVALRRILVRAFPRHVPPNDVLHDVGGMLLRHEIEQQHNVEASKDVLGMLQVGRVQFAEGHGIQVVAPKRTCCEVVEPQLAGDIDLVQCKVWQDVYLASLMQRMLQKVLQIIQVHFLGGGDGLDEVQGVPQDGAVEEAAMAQVLGVDKPLNRSPREVARCHQRRPLFARPVAGPAVPQVALLNLFAVVAVEVGSRDALSSPRFAA